MCLKAHTGTRVEEIDDYMLVYIDRLDSQLLRGGVRRREVHDIRKQRDWRQLCLDNCKYNAELCQCR